MPSPADTEDNKKSFIFIRISKGIGNLLRLRQKKSHTVDLTPPVPIAPIPATSGQNPIPEAPVAPMHEAPVIEETKPESAITINTEEYSTFFLFLCSDELKAASAAVLFVGNIAIALAVFSPSILGAAATIALLTGTGMTTVSALTMVVSFGCGFFKKQAENEEISTYEDTSKHPNMNKYVV